MASQLEQPWRVYLPELAIEHIDRTYANANYDSDGETPLKPVKEKLCPGGPDCSFEPHALGTTKACAVETNIGIVFMNSSG